MNNLTTSTRLRRILATAAFGALISGLACVASAAAVAGAPQSMVKYADLNLSSPQGAAALYSRIQKAAHRVCQPDDNHYLALMPRTDACIRKAIADAVKAVGQPLLFAVYAAKNGTSQPIILAAGGTR
jgi:UrcA family protein